MLPHFIPQPLPTLTTAEKLAANLAALRTMRALHDGQRPATAEERAAIALYTGWGDTAVRKLAIRSDDTPSLALLQALGAAVDPYEISKPRYAGGYYSNNRTDHVSGNTPHTTLWAERWDDASDASVATALAAMRQSALNAHYTPIPIVRAMWGVLLHLGFGDLRAPYVLEPSAGVGHFLGCLPVDAADVLLDRVVGVELDVASAAICRALYPGCDVRQGAFQDVAAALPPSFDVVVGNVPFGNYQVADGANVLPGSCTQQVHDYFVCRSVSLLRPGGVACLVTSKGTLDKQTPAVRRWLAERASLVGAFRLPGCAFSADAGTDVTTDVLVLQRHADGGVRPHAAGSDEEPEWVRLAPVKFPGRYGDPVEDMINAYFVSHPDHVLGDWCQNKLVWAPDAGVCRRPGDDRDVGDMIRAVTGRLPAGALRPQAPTSTPIVAGHATTKAPLKPGTYAGSGDLAPTTPQEVALGRVLRAVRRVLAATEAGDGVPAVNAGPASAASVGAADRPQHARRLLAMAYDAYTASYGQVRAAERDAHHPLHRHAAERWWPLVACLEDDRGRKTGVHTGPTVAARGAAPPQTAVDALYQVIDERGSFTLEQVAEKLNAGALAAPTGPADGCPVHDAPPLPAHLQPWTPTPAADAAACTCAQSGPVPITTDTARQELRGAVYQLGPGGAWATREQYCSGDVVAKLDEARQWASIDAATFSENVDALAGAQPPRVPLADITVPFGAPWVDKTVYIAFFRHLFPAFDGWGVTLAYVAETATWLLVVTNKYLLGSVENTRTYGTGRMTAVDLIECGLRLRLPVVYDENYGDDGETHRTKNEAETNLAAAKLQDIREQWAAWLPGDPARAQLLEDEYNHRFNRIVPRTYDGSRLTFPGLSLTYQGRPFAPYAHQVAGALRVLERGDGDDTAMLSYAPGLGKTAAAILGVVKRLQLGLSRKAVVVVPKAVLHQWQATFADLYPGHAAWLLAGTDRAFDARNRRRFLNEAALGDARIILLTYEQFRTVPLQPATFRAYLRREVLDLERAMGEYGDTSADPAKKNLERAFKARQRSLADFEAKYAKKWQKVTEAGDADVAWEHWGCDLLCLDEAHFLKNLGYNTAMDGIAGLPRSESQRAFDGCIKLHYVTTPELFPGLGQAARPGAPAEVAYSVRLPADASADAITDALLDMRKLGAAVAVAAPVRPDLVAGKGIFLTGTPVTNSIAETYIMMRLLQPRLLRRLGLWHFDAWAATFTTQHPAPEMDAVGNWRVRTRLRFHNLPELQDLLGLCWDRVDPRTAGGTRPSIIGGRMRVVETEGSEDLNAYTADLADRAEAVKARKVDPTEDNMLKITHDGRCASVFNGPPSEHWPDTRACAACGGTGAVPGRDPRGGTGDDSCSTCDACAGRCTVPHRTKVDALVGVAWDLYVHSDAAQGCQLVFVDLFTPKAASTVDDDTGANVAPLTPEEQFTQRGVYGVIRDKLVRAGMLPAEVAYIHDAASDEERKSLFAAANAGTIRVLIGSTQKMGLGVNVQRRAYAAHHLTVPWRPDWLDQANKRVDRDGNTMDAVHLVCYPTTGSYDVVLWQMIETKGEFVAAINSGTYAGRSADDIGDLVIDATTAKAVALGDLRVIEKVKLELELGQLQRQHKVWKNENIRSRWELENLPDQIAEKQRDLDELAALKAHRDAHQLAGFRALLRPAMVADATASPTSWTAVNDRTQADQRVHVLADSLRHKLGSEGLLVGQYRGLDLLLVRDGAGVHLEAHHGPDGWDKVKVRNVGVRSGIGAFAQLEAELATLETQMHRLGTQRDILAARHATLAATAPAWAQAGRAANLLTRYDELCAAVATAGIVDRQEYRFS